MGLARPSLQIEVRCCEPAHVLSASICSAQARAMSESVDASPGILAQPAFSTIPPCSQELAFLSAIN